MYTYIVLHLSILKLYYIYIYKYLYIYIQKCILLHEKNNIDKVGIDIDIKI